MRMYLISDNIDTYTGMRLSGVEGVVVHEREELEEALSFVTGQPGYRDRTADRKTRQGFSGTGK